MTYRLGSLVLLLTVALLGGCVADDADDAAKIGSGAGGVSGDDMFEDWAEDPVTAGFVEKAGSCTSRWIASEAAAAEANTQHLPYSGAKSICNGGPTSGALAFGDYVREHFGPSMNLTVPGRGIQIYNCRSVRGGTSNSVHGDGRAVDIFFNTPGGAADNRNGDPVANWIIANAEHIGVQMIIWDRTIWTASRDPQARCYTGTNPHYDHIHAELTWAGARKETGFFRDLAAGTLNGPQISGGSLSSWIGSSCIADAECGFVESGLSGHCWRPGGMSAGVCSILCDGYCPDRGGYAPTFCADPTSLGGTADGGRCLPRSDSLNGSCSDIEGFVETPALRFVGTSGATRIERVVCMPDGVTVLVDDPVDDPAVTDPSGNTDPEPPIVPDTTEDPDPDGVGDTVTEDQICDPSLAMSENDDSCVGWAAETWRCACSATLATTVSQVCRGGRWLNYQTEPADCGRCDGAHTDGCDHLEEGNGGVCAEEALPLSDTGYSCAGTVDETWRCACHERFGETTSQVCRGGRWINYELNPRDCTRCDGGYTGGCEAR